MDDEMMKALEADGEKLRQLTGEDHGPFALCPTCVGLFGMLEFPEPRPDDPYYCRVEPCPDCNGTGYAAMTPQKLVETK